MNHRVLESEKISFDAVFDNIRILFTAPAAQGIQYNNLPAFVIPLPTDMVRLQRREFYRDMTPVTSTVYSIIPTRDSHGTRPEERRAGKQGGGEGRTRGE